MGTAADLFPRCDHEVGCITCGDEAVEMHVVRVDAGEGLAQCARDDGALSAVDVALVEPVGRGDLVLVHAGVALRRLDGVAVEPGGAT